MFVLLLLLLLLMDGWGSFDQVKCAGAYIESSSQQTDRRQELAKRLMTGKPGHHWSSARNAET